VAGVTGVNPNASVLDAPRPNEFQRYVLETAGYKLPLFGLSFFDNVQFSQRASANPLGGLGFAALDQAPVSGDYLLGVGDQLIIRGWGAIDLDVRASIDRNGAINIPRVGAVPLAGVKAAQAESVLRQAIAKYYKDFQISVTLAGLRGITVYVVGQARRPGSYTLSGVATLVSGLLATGGPGPNGSMRRVQLKRAGQVMKEFDLYAFLAKGENSGDIRLIDGDVIVIPPALGHVALLGKVNNPAVYEIKRAGETLADLLEVAGGLPVVADLRRVTLERLQAEKTQPRSVLDFALNAQGTQTQLQNGDLLTVQSVLPELTQTVTLRGNVTQPTRLAWREGMRVRDLIPSKEALISRDSVRRQNEALFDAAQLERAQRERDTVPEDLQSDTELDRRLQRAQRLSGRGAWGLQDQNGKTDSTGMPSVARATQGMAMTQNAPATPGAQGGQSAQGGPSPQGPNGAQGFALIDRVGLVYDEINWDYALIERIRREDLTEQLIPFHLGSVMADASHPDNQLLQPGDIVTVFSVQDLRVPLEKRRIFVRVEGEVGSPGIYQSRPDETLPDLIKKAGGLTRNAYLYGAAFYREEVRKSQIENQIKLVRRLEADSANALATFSQSTGASTDASLMQARVAAAQQAQRQAIERVRSLRPEGRIALGLEPVLETQLIQLPDLRLQNGDRLFVPAKPDFVYVFGSVSTESSLIFKPGMSVSDYLKQAGMNGSADRNNVVLVRADGSALSSDSGWFGRSILGVSVMPGDAIVVPDKIDLEATWSTVVRNTKDLTQIFYQLGLGAAAIKTLRN
jgi:protein involved in polysaccharide export with SLBB domain